MFTFFKIIVSLLFLLVGLNSKATADTEFYTCESSISSTSDSQKPVLDKKQIKQLLPHRGFMLLVDRVLKIFPQQTVKKPRDIAIGSTIMAQLDIFKDRKVFKKHYPGSPIFPGNLIAEAIEQAAALLVLTQVQSPEPLYPILLGTSQQQNLKPVVPGNLVYPVTLKVELIHIEGSDLFFKGSAILPNGSIAMDIQEIKATLVNERLMRRFLRPSSNL
ncbi:MAG: hypothetical protein KDD58_09835 [Bdellovibrionales bacterium]|nr:hypothetical protein [Bdellovibrionales bacterium]